MKNKIMLLIFVSFILLFSLTLTSAKPPFQQSATETGIIIEVPIIETIKEGQTFEFHLHAHNSTDSLLIKPGDLSFCAIHIYNSTGDHRFQGNMSANGNNFDMEKTVLGSNFTEGMYAVLLYCEISDVIGGFFEFSLLVTSTGTELTTGKSLLYSLSLLSALLIFCLSLWGSLKIPWGHMKDADQTIVSVNDFRFVKIFLIAITYIMLMFIFAILFNISNSFLELGSINSLFFWLYTIMLSLAWPLIVLTFILAFIVFLYDLNLTKKLSKGFIIK